MKQGALTQTISMILVVLLLIAGIGAIAYFTGGFTGEFKTFYLTVGDRDILTSATGFQVSVDEPLTVNVKYTFAEDGVNGYFTIDGIPYSFQAESDLTAGFEIEENESSFTLKPKGTLNEVMAAVYPNSEIEDLTGKGYENMFLLVVDSYNGASTVTLAFSIVEGVSGIEIKPGHMYF